MSILKAWIACLVFFQATFSFSQITCTKLDSGVLITEGEQKVLFYRTIEKENQDEYGRANYVHPLYGLDGEILTEDYPADHRHHHGIFWAWHQLYIGHKRIGDGWVNKDLSWKVVSVDDVSGSQEKNTITARIEWLSPLWIDAEGNQTPVMVEELSIKVYPQDSESRIIDFTISLLAMQPNTRIGGSEDKKGYGGFSPRIRLPEDVQFEGINGPVEAETTPVEAAGWLSISGALGKEGSQAGLAILSHPENPSYPNPWILRNRRSMQNAVYPHPGATAVPLSHSKPTVLNYRIVVFGEHQPDFKALHDDYSRQ